MAGTQRSVRRRVGQLVGSVHRTLQRRESGLEPIDILSSGPYPGSELSNFAAHTFVFRGLRTGSMEGLLQSLKSADPEEQQRIMRLAGSAAKKAGRGLDWRREQTVHWQGRRIDRHGAEYQQLLDEAFRALFSESGRARQALRDSGRAPLRHTIGESEPTETILTEEEFITRLMRHRDELHP